VSFRKTPAETNLDCHQPVCLLSTTGRNTRLFLGPTAGLSAPFISKMSQSYFQGYSPVMFPASSPYRPEPELLVKESMQGEDAYVERRDKSVNPYFYALTGIFIDSLQDSV
jgi:hypothetical protein